MEELEVLLVGQPNVGKSSLLNTLVGPRVTVSNYPGTTVEITKAKKVFNNVKIKFLDTPGIYSISDRSKEEKVTERALFKSNPDKVVVILDSTSLERGLYMVLQVLEMGLPVVVALNFVEDAEDRGININSEKLEKLLGVPVVPINALTGEGVEDLLNSLLEEGKGKEFGVEYDDHIEKAIKELSNKIKEEPARFIALRILEGDEDFYKFLKDETIKKVKADSLKDHPEVSEDIAITRYGTACFIAEKATELTVQKGRGFGEKIDEVLLDKVWGPIITAISFLGIFGALLYLGNLIQGVLTSLTEFYLSSFVTESSFLAEILFKGLNGLLVGVSIALPYVFLFYLILGFLEDIGLLSRFIVNARRMLTRFGLPGKSLLSLLLGLGCTAPAVKSTRILSNKKEQFYTISFFPFVPCSSRIAIIMGVVGFYGNLTLVLSVFATLLAGGALWALIMRITTHIEKKPLLLELPPYRRPLVKNVLSKSWIRMKSFVYIVIPLLALGGIAYGILNGMGLTKLIISPFSPITSWLGLPEESIIPIIFGFLQKDLTGSMLLSVLNISTLSPLQLYTFGVVTTMQIPCIIAFGMITEEVGLKRALLLTLISFGYGLILSGLIWRMILIL